VSQPGSWRRRRYSPLAVGALLLLLAAARPTVARSGSPDAEVSRWDQPRNVLLLHAYPRLSPAVVSVDEAFRETLAAASPFPIETAGHQPGVVGISIRDTGIGVKDADLEHIFEHFVSSKPDGLGMGLAISRSIVQAHGGHIWATANLDRDLTVHVELPGEGETVRP
jgi:K+-sensing histidine kinase KdpD